MLSVLADRTYRHLFSAQVIALIGTGMMTVALGLLAFKIADDKAGAVLGTALAIKMVAYVGVAPVVGGFANYLPRRAFLVSMDLMRAAVAIALPFVDQVWQVYVLIFVLQAASAAFTPTFQATIPDVLPNEAQYTRALSLSRLAYDMESLLSPTLAAALLTLITYNWLFVGTVVGFLCSAGLVLSVTVPQPEPSARKGGIYANTTRGIRIYLATPRLREPAGTEFVGGRRRRHGDREHGRPRAQRLGRIRQRGGSRARLFWRRLDDRSTSAAQAAGPAVRSCSHASVGRRARRGASRLRGDRVSARDRRVALAGPAVGVDAIGCRLLGGDDALRPPAAAIRPRCGPPGSVCGAVRPLPCLLAADLPARRLDRLYDRNDPDPAGPRRDLFLRRLPRTRAMAVR